MIYELIFTSVPRGLKSNRSGFTTAAATVGMSRAAMTALERLSGYSFHFNLSDPRASQNPTNFAHTCISIGRDTCSILSRIGFAGADYSGRANKIAHHILLPAGEQPAEGPAEILLQLREGALRSEYMEPPQELPARNLQQLLDGAPGQAQRPSAWQAQTGDAGWAGALARAYRTNRRVPGFVIFEPGADLLPLFAESLALLPPQDRWQVCFATYYSASLPVGTQCHWRGILAGSAQMSELGRYPNATVIDLMKPLGAPQEDAYTEAAREGAVLAAPQRRPAKTVDIAETLAQPAAAGEPTPADEETHVLAPKSQSETGPEPGYDPRQLGPVPAPTLVYRPTGPGYDEPPRRFWKLALGAFVILLVVSNALIGWLLVNAKSRSQTYLAELTHLKGRLQEARNQRDLARRKLQELNTRFQQGDSKTNKEREKHLRNSSTRHENSARTAPTTVGSSDGKLSTKQKGDPFPRSKPVPQSYTSSKPTLVRRALTKVPEERWGHLTPRSMKLRDSFIEQGRFQFTFPENDAPTSPTGWTTISEEPLMTFGGSGRKGRISTWKYIRQHFESGNARVMYKCLIRGVSTGESFQPILTCEYLPQERVVRLEVEKPIWDSRGKSVRELYSITVGLCADQRLYVLAVPKDALKGFGLRTEEEVAIVFGKSKAELHPSKLNFTCYAWPRLLSADGKWERKVAGSNCSLSIDKLRGNGNSIEITLVQKGLNDVAKRLREAQLRQESAARQKSEYESRRRGLADLKEEGDKLRRFANALKELDTDEKKGIFGEPLSREIRGLIEWWRKKDGEIRGSGKDRPKSTRRQMMVRIDRMLGSVIRHFTEKLSEAKGRRQTLRDTVRKALPESLSVRDPWKREVIKVRLKVKIED